jgi:hypothetical protein
MNGTSSPETFQNRERLSRHQSPGSTGFPVKLAQGYYKKVALGPFCPCMFWPIPNCGCLFFKPAGVLRHRSLRAFKPYRIRNRSKRNRFGVRVRTGLCIRARLESGRNRTERKWAFSPCLSCPRPEFSAAYKASENSVHAPLTLPRHQSPGAPHPRFPA